MVLPALHAPIAAVVGSGAVPRGARIGTIVADTRLGHVLALHGPWAAAAMAWMVARKVAVGGDAEGRVAAGIVGRLVCTHDGLELCDSALASGATDDAQATYRCGEECLVKRRCSRDVGDCEGSGYEEDGIGKRLVKDNYIEAEGST
jgi:hypothetical protein